MLYQLYQALTDMVTPIQAGARAALTFSALAGPGLPESASLRKIEAFYEMLSQGGLTAQRPAYGIPRVRVNNRDVEVIEEVAHATPFGSLIHFRKDIASEQPRVLVVAPMSGHFATLLRDTIRTLLIDHDVYITDWHNARDVPLSAGRFGFDDFIDHLITFLEVIGPGAHMLAVCQPSAPALAVAAIMEEDDHPARPRSLTLMAGPIDTRINPTRVNRLATTRPIQWFEHNLIATVPWRFRGALRRVYPGFLQLTAFMTMNLERHVKTHLDMFHHLAAGDRGKAEPIRTFYDEYFAVMDMPAEFYLETVRLVFQEHALARGRMTWHGRKVDTGAIRRLSLLTVEGERDDICSVGQTLAAQDLCRSVHAYKKIHHVQTGVGHYGVFSGRRWQNEIYPIVRDLIHVND